MAQSPVQNTPQKTLPPQGQPPAAQPSAPSTPSQPFDKAQGRPSQPPPPSFPFDKAPASGKTSAGGQGKPSLPSVPRFKLPPLKLPLLLALVAFGAGALGIALIFFFQKQNTVVKTQK